MKVIFPIIVAQIVAAGGTAMNLDEASLSTTPVVLLKGSTPLSLGTGFLYSRDEPSGQAIVFLITNRHVLTGHGPAEKAAPIGDRIVFYCHKDATNPAQVEELSVPLFTAAGKPIWVESQRAPEADIAAIPLGANVGKNCQLVCVSKTATNGPIRLRPTSNVALVGYPYGFSDEINHLPVWKAGTIASEPEVDFDGKPLFLVDVSAFPGMSGSPVFAFSQGPYEDPEGNFVARHIRTLVGVFSSMRTIEEKKPVVPLSTKPKGAVEMSQSLQLGYVWKVAVLVQLIESFDVAKYEHDVLGKVP